MKKMINALLPLIIFSLIVALLLTGLRHNPKTVPSPFIGKPAPTFPGSEGLFKGHVTLFNVFASWCSYCRVEHPVLMDIAHTKRVTLIGLNYKDQITKARAMLAEYGNPYSKVISDPTGSIAINFGVYGTPETFIIDKKAVIRYRHTGPISLTDWKERLLPLVEKLRKENT